MLAYYLSRLWTKDKLCVGKLYVSKLWGQIACGGGNGRRAGGGGNVELKTRTPHKDMGNKTPALQSNYTNI